jgi:hypothetical protein
VRKGGGSGRGFMIWVLMLRDIRPEERGGGFLGGLDGSLGDRQRGEVLRVRGMCLYVLYEDSRCLTAYNADGATSRHNPHKPLS